MEPPIASTSVSVSAGAPVCRPQAVERAADDAACVMNAMTVDVEEHFQVSAFEATIARETWEQQDSRVAASTERLLDLLDDAGVKATFFVLGWVAERQHALVKRIAERGHELACHGYSHRLIYEQRPEEFREEVLRAKRVLEDVAGVRVHGHRAASFSIGRSNLWALEVVAEAGFTYDSSVFPVNHDRYGMPGAPRGPYRLLLASGHELLELPPSTVELGAWALPVAGGGYLRLYPAFLTSWAVRRLNRREGRPAVVYVHPWELDTTQPRVAGAPWLDRFRHSVNLGTTAGKLAGLLRRHRFAPVREVLERLGPIPSARLQSGTIELVG